MYSALLLTVLTLGDAAPPRELTWNPAIDGTVTAVLVSGWLVSEVALKKTLAPAHCRWCEANDFDTTVRRTFNPSLIPTAEGERIADLSSSVLGFGILPLIMVGVDAWLASSTTSDHWFSTVAIDVLLAVEATFSAVALNQLVKFSVGRGRPFSIGASPELLAQAHDPLDGALSFFSGHTTLAFGLVSSLTTLAYMRGYKAAPLMWMVGIPLAFTTSFLRLAADKHWATDVLVGMAVGTGFGIALPILFHAPLGKEKGVNARLVPTGNGVALAGSF